MPWINKKPKKKRDYKLDLNSEKRQFSSKLYGSTGWQRLRLAKLAEQPLCQRCTELGVIKLASEVHHVNKFMHQKSDEDKVLYFYDYNNLMSLCPECHYFLDNKKTG